jgi:hypothetical protein
MTGNDTDRKSTRPTARQLQIAIEQPGEADEATMKFLNEHPAVRRVFERARKLDLLAEHIGKNNPEFDWDAFARRVDEMCRGRSDGPSK